MRKFLLFLILLLIGCFLFYGVIKWVGWEEVKETLFTFSGYKGIVILAVTILIWLSGVWRWRFILKSQGCNVSILGLGEIFFAGTTINYFFSPPVYFGGELFRAYIARKKFSLPQEKNFAAIVIEKILSASVILVFLILGIVSFIFLTELPFENFGIITIGLIGVLAVGLSVFYFRSFKKESILRYFFRFSGLKNNKNSKMIKNIEKETFRFFDFKKSLMWKGLGIAFLRYFLILARCWFLVFFLTGETGFLISLIILFFLILASILPLPARLGGLEITQAFAFGSLGLGKVVGITFSFIIRGAEILVALFGLMLLIKLGIKFSKESIEKTTNKFKIKRRR